MSLISNETLKLTAEEQASLAMPTIALTVAVCFLAFAIISLFGVIFRIPQFVNPFASSTAFDLKFYVALVLLGIAVLSVMQFHLRSTLFFLLARWLAAVVIVLAMSDGSGGAALQARTDLALAGTAVIFLTTSDARLKRWAQYIAMIIGSSAAFSMLAHTYVLTFLLTTKYIATISISSSILFYFVAFIIFFARPAFGPASVFLSSLSGGRVARRIILPLMLIYPFLGFVTGIGPKYQLDLTVLVLLTNFVLPIVLWVVAVESDRASRSRLQAYELVAENEKLNANLAQAVAAESAARGVSKMQNQFMANISHELRTPLAAILGATQLNMLNGQSEEQRELSKMANESAQSLLELVNEMLSFATTQSHTVRLNYFELELQPFVETTIQMVQPIADRKGLKIFTSAAPDVPKCINTDAVRLRQVLMNLLDNAIKFSSQGSLNVYIQMLRDATENRTTLKFGITDYGPGIRKEDQARVFEPFTQLDPSATREHGGVGLGLNISKTLVQLMGGDIGVDSIHGHGSTFWFTIPLLDVQSLAEPEKPTERLRGDILIVEDNATTAKILSLQLRKLGFKSDIATNGKEAVEAVQKQKNYALVLMDWQMPVMDGIEATRAIRTLDSPNAHSVPIVACTAHIMPEDRLTCLKAGMNDYLSKPVSLEALQTVTDRWVPRTRTNAA